MSHPLIFSHFNYQPYLAYTLAQARETNPDRRLILLGDDENRDVAIRNGWEHHLHSRFSNQLHKRFARAYRPIYGRKQSSGHIKTPPEKEWYLFWLRYVTERWFFVESFTEQMKIESFWHFDSDTMILQDLSGFEEAMANFDLTLQCNTICLNGHVKRHILKEFCEYTCRLFEDFDYVAKQQVIADSTGTDQGFTEMSAFLDFKQWAQRREIWLMEYSVDLVFDDCLAQDHGFATEQISDGRSVKKIVFENGHAHGIKQGRKVEFITLNLSWLPIYMYIWVYAAQKKCAVQDVGMIDFKKLYSPIVREKSREVSASRLGLFRDDLGSSLEKLRKKFKSSRKILVTFASTGIELKRQRRIGQQCLDHADFNQFESWTYDMFRSSAFFLENKTKLRLSRLMAYGIYKPYITYRVLQSANDGDLIVFSDSSTTDTTHPLASVLPLLDWLSAGPRRLVAPLNPWTNSLATKRDCFVFMGCDTFQYWSQQQISSSFLAFIVNTGTRKLIEDWLNFCTDERIVTDQENTSGIANFPDFTNHHMEQSVLSNLLIRDGFIIPTASANSVPASYSLQSMLNLFPGSVTENNSGLPLRSIAVGKPWIASSGTVWSPQRGTVPESGGSSEFFFHTMEEDDPWWLLDLQENYMIHKIIILNRSNPAFATRASRLKISLGLTEDEMITIFDGATDLWEPTDPLVINVDFALSRYLKAELDTFETLHLSGVQVYGVPAYAFTS